MSDHTALFPGSLPDQSSGNSSRSAPAIVPVASSRGKRTVGVLIVDPDGTRWQRTIDIEGLVRLGVTAAAAVALPVGIATALRRPAARVDRLSMGPGGWVSFKGFAVPKGRQEHRPWWAVLLGIHRAT